MLESLFNKVIGLQAWNFFKKETPTQVFSCEICEIYKNTYFEEHLRTTASEKRNQYEKLHLDVTYFVKL